ncbi:PA14 domain-containing protein [Paracoccus sp. DMF-8]|uniref:PA14 domain-containing protein n=1 Tax=Paracoccus sp. DMF-8 TaxID=3019445 RepID=UPI0023E862AF|nr:PA14 domain-containing protein [Paracoccus sp. DMF-8]MDF3605839.1 PA14 domain-containing protein [Paracoccus sp. DMF-8]
MARAGQQQCPRTYQWRQLPAMRLRASMPAAMPMAIMRAVKAPVATTVTAMMTATSGTPMTRMQGLRAEYLTLEAAAASLSQIDFNGNKTATGHVNSLAWSRESASFWDGGRTDLFAARFVGDLNVQTGGRYTFYLTSDDGSALYIDGRRVIDNDVAHATTLRTVQPDLARFGEHSIEIRYFENFGAQSLQLEWRGPDSNNTRGTHRWRQSQPRRGRRRWRTYRRW